MRLSVSSAKSVQSIGNNKAVHIPGLPSSLTIERIGSDSIVCIRCENPGKNMTLILKTLFKNIVFLSSYIEKNLRECIHV